jgi:hypothetical protein
MTQQVRTAYRRHRRGTWALAALLVLAGAAILIPVASGASDKTYTLGFAAATQQSPSPPLTRAPLCTSTTGQQVTLYLTNTAKTASLGSARITLPSYATGATAYRNTSTTPLGASSFSYTNGASSDTVFLQNLSLGKWGYVKLVVNVSPSAVGTTAITAIVKQSNQFNDSGGDANLFENPQSWPSLTVQNCVVKIAGRVFRDANGDGSGTGDSGLSGRTVTATGGHTDTTDANGLYELSVPAGGSYTVCVTQIAGEVQTAPDPATACSGAGGHVLTTLTTDVTGKDFGLAGGVTAECGTVLTSSFESGNATVEAKFGGSVCKVAGLDFVFTTYADGGIRVAKLEPVDPPAAPPACDRATGENCITVAQRISWELGATPDVNVLSYDDPPYGAAGDPRTMPFCLKDPIDPDGADGLTLETGSDYDPEDILPAGETTCLIESSQGPGPDPLRIDLTYSSVDGRINLGG